MNSLPKRLLPEPGSRNLRFVLITKLASPQLWGRHPLTIMGVSQGPRVGDKTPIAAITEEYAKGDPIYVAKTLVSFSSHLPFALLPLGNPIDESVLMVVQALPETYSHYRPVKGDGNCGWRGKPLPSSHNHRICYQSAHLL